MTALLLGSVVFALGSFALFAAGSRDSRPLPNRPTADESRVERWPYFRSALAVRLLAASAIWLTGMSDFFAPDRRGYEAAGRVLAATWAGESLVRLDVVVGEVNFHHYANGVSFFLGVGSSLVLLANCILGALVPGLVASIAGRLGGDWTARKRAALLAAFLPSLIVWSAINIRDIWALTAILFALDSALALHDRLSVGKIATFCIAMVLLGLLRGYMFVLVSVGLGLAVVASASVSKMRGLVAATITAVICVYLYSATGFGQHWVEDASLERLANIREGMTGEAQSAYAVDADISTTGGALRFLPVGLAHFWLGPFPWEIRNMRQAIALPELLVLYWLIPSFVLGLIRAARDHFGRAASIASVVAVVSIAYSLVEGNYGTAYRHRAQVLAPVIAVIGIGLAERERRRSAVAMPQRA